VFTHSLVVLLSQQNHQAMSEHYLYYPLARLRR